MYTAKITNKDVEKKQITVEFSDGVKAESITISPQDRPGFMHWVESEVESRDTLEALLQEDNLNKVIEIPKPAVPTQAEKDRQLWLERDALKDLVDIAIKKGYLTGTEPKVVALNSWLKTNFKPEYIGIV